MAANSSLKSRERVGGVDRRWLGVGAVLLVLILSLWLAQSGAPKAIQIVTGPPGTTDYDFATRYAEALRDEHLEATIVESPGGAESLKRLLGIEESAFAFVMSGAERELQDEGVAEQVFSLGAIGLEPLWIFVRTDSGITSLEQLEGSRALLGEPGSKSRALGDMLLDEHGIEVTELSFETPEEIYRQLASGGADVGFFVGDPGSDGISKLLAAPLLRPISLELTQAYIVRHPWLRAVTYPKGAFDLQTVTPTEDLKLVAGSANLVIPRGLQPVVIDLLLDIASEVHVDPGAFWNHGTFPNPDGTSLGLDPAAERFYREGPSKWRRVLPYRLATIADRFTVVIIPVLTAVLVVFQLIPAFLRMRLNMSLKKLYRRLEDLEKRHSDPASSPEGVLQDLATLDADSVNLWVPRSQMAPYFEFRQNIHDMRDRVSRADPGEASKLLE